ncbi:conserved hypothetical protein [Culex quinquefasciatus]|uniref:Chitin-binding type-2 domain-containing protein n=1 Tax=Culex quinquefasciatus TaxID=7176 RepID=B0WAA8_CULQU|nr:conserved hypothetical protein [Culex quinquefasciatus]|eukprot:XP_001845642.1 conserved hypothetical protein [Culex quinquefasciatus]
MELECRPEGTKFDHVREVCDHPENVECYNPDRCELEEDGSIIPSETCTNFHICRNGVKSDEITCVPEGTLFDYNRRVCDHPENVVCWGDEAEVTEPTTEGSGTTLEPTRPPVPEDIPSDICRGIVIDILPHPGDCTQFVVCVLGQPSVDSCPPDFIFYPQIGVCGYGNTETCDIDPRWLEDYLREQERWSYNPVQLEPYGGSCEENYQCQESAISENVRVLTPAQPCPERGTAFRMHEQDCSLYYYCRDGVERLQSCGFDQFDMFTGRWSYNPVQLEPYGGSCEENYQCQESAISENVRVLTPAQPCPERGTAFRMHEQDCSLYYYCRDGVERLQSCGFDQFDMFTGRCVRRNQATCFPGTS